MARQLTKFFFIFFASLPVFSQGGSNYSIFGIGDVIYGNGAAYEAMGGTQTAVLSNNNINLLNPAMLAFVNTTRLQTGYRFNQNVVSNDANKLWQNNGSINGFAAIFNFDTTLKISAAVVMQPLTTVNYYMSMPVEMNIDDATTIYGAKQYKGSGGLSSLSANLGSKITDLIYLGGTFSAIFGKTDHVSNANFQNYYSKNYELTRSNTFEAYSYKLGIYLSPIDKLGIGLFYEYTRDANVTHRDEYVFPFAGNVDGNPIIETKVESSFEKNKMPNYFGAGFSYVTGKFMIAGDYLMGTFADLEPAQSHTMNFRNLQRFSLGVNRMGNPNPFAALSDKIAYKFGAYYEQLYYKINNNDINEAGLTCGAQLPLSRNSQIDLAFVFGKRGVQTSGLISEYFGRMIIDISIGDTWFNPIKKY